MFIRPKDRGSRPLYTADDAFLYASEAYGLTLEAMRVSSVVIGAFSRRAHAALVRLSQALPVAGQPREIMRGTWRDSIFDIIRLSVGAPAAVATVEDLFPAGMRVFITYGTAGGLQHDQKPGDLVIPTGTIREDGTSYHYLAPGEQAAPDVMVVDALRVSLGGRGLVWREGPVWTTDAPYREFVTKVQDYRDDGCLAVEMECSGIFAAAQVLGVRAATLLVVSDVLTEEWKPAFRAREVEQALAGAAPAVLDAAAAMAEKDAQGVNA